MGKTIVLFLLLVTNLSNMPLSMSKMPDDFSKLYLSDKRITYSVAQDLYYSYAIKLQREINSVRAANKYPAVSLQWTRRFLFSWIKQESGFKNDAKSIIGCIGLLQICPQVWGIADKWLSDPAINLYVGFVIFKHYLVLAKGNIKNALLYYNNGYVWVNMHYANDIFAQIKLY